MLRSVLYWVGKSSDYSLTPAEGGGVARIYCIGTPLTLTPNPNPNPNPNPRPAPHRPCPVLARACAQGAKVGPG